MQSNHVNEIAKTFRLPTKVISQLQKLGVIGKSIGAADILFLHAYRKTWANQFLLKCQLSRLSIQQRQEIIDNPFLTEKWELYIYGEYFFSNSIDTDGDDELYSDGMNELVKILTNYFLIIDSADKRLRIKTIIRMANNDRKKVNSGRTTAKQILTTRRLPLTELDFFKETFTYHMCSS